MIQNPPSDSQRSSSFLTRREMLTSGAAALVAFAATAQTSIAATSQTSADNPNLALIKRYCGVYAQGDLNAPRQFFAPDIVWRIPGHGPLAGDKRGRDEVIAFFAQLAKCQFEADVIALTAGGDWVIDLHRGYSNAGGGHLDITWALAYRIQDGRIVEAIDFAFDQAAADTFWWSNYPLKPLPERLANE